MVYKRCPECQQWIPVACKTCPCGHAFSGRKSSISQADKKDATEETPLEPKQRRTERTKRQRPDFFNALEFESHMRKVSRRRTESSRSEDCEPPKKAGRGRPKGSTTKHKVVVEEGSSNSPTPVQSVTENKEIEKEDEILYANLPPDKVLQYSIILAELNRKYTGQNFKPI